MLMSFWMRFKPQLSHRGTVAFPNRSRSYNESKHCVRFWGHDGTSEIAFDLAEATLISSIKGKPRPTEPSILKMFDANRPKIEGLAQSAHGSETLRYHFLF